ncbi:MAG: PHP domain-containing protein [Asgard group archaeon]|nr:PHP domain-containing protein [Asgard group archaeon]
MKLPRKLPKIVKHLLVFFLIIGSIMIISVLLAKFGPAERNYFDDSWEDLQPFVPNTNVTYDILFDQHSHTKYSDGKLTIRQSIEWHKALGFNAFAITDHNTLKNSEEIADLANEYKNEIIVLQGMEWTTRRLHLNFLGIEEWNLKIPLNPTTEDIIEAINEVHNQGGVVTANHLLYSERSFGDITPSRNQLVSWGVDFFEIVNGQDFDHLSYDYYLEHNVSISLITGTDIHSPDRSDGGKVNAWTAINVTEFTKEALMDQLREGKTEFIIDSFGVEILGRYKDNLVYDIFQPFYELGTGLIYLYLRFDKSFSPFVRIVVIVFIVYSFGIFAFSEVVIAVRNTVKLRKRKFIKNTREND